MKILFLSRWFPYPASNGSKLRIFNLLRGLAQAHQVTLLSFNDQPEQPPEVAGLESICEAVHVVPWRPYQPDSHSARRGFLSMTPRFVVDTYSAEMEQKLTTCLAAGAYDVVIASQFDMAVYSPHFGGVPALFEEVEVGVLYEKFKHARTMQRRLRHGLTWFKHRRYLSKLLNNFQVCTVVSTKEQQIVRGITRQQQPVEVIPNCVDLSSYQDVEAAPYPNRLIFTGAFSYYPNHEAMVWFLKEAYPLIQEAVPEVQLTITGKHGNKPLPPATGVTLTGFVDDVRPLIANAWASLVPLHTGGGTRLKILEAMALRTPVVATSKGAEGLQAEADKHLLIADSPQEYARAVIRLLTEPALREYLAANGYQLIRDQYDWAGIMPRLLELVCQTAAARPAASPALSPPA